MEAQHLSIPNERSPSVHGLPNSKGAVAFYKGLDLIGSARRFIKAVDISDLKGGIETVYSSAVYKGWYARTLSRAHELEFRRLFVLRREGESVEKFLAGHAASYFDGKGASYGNCRVMVVFADDLDRRIQGWSAGAASSWLNDRPQLVRHLKHVGQWSDDPKQVVRVLLRRDFLITEEMIYDYRTESVDFDLQHLQDYLVPFENEHNAEDRARFIREWEDIFALFLTLVSPIMSERRAELEERLRAGCQQRPAT